MTMPTRRGLWGAAGLLVIALAIWRLRGPTIAVDAARVDEGPLTLSVDESGTTRVRGHVDLNAPVTGRWVPAGVLPGDSLSAGGVVGRLYPVPLDVAAQQQADAQIGVADAALRDAEAQVMAARTALREAVRTRERAEAMATAGGLSPQEVERARAEETARHSALEGAEQRARAAAYALASARAVRPRTDGTRAAVSVRSPVRGVVLRLMEEHERVVTAGSPLAEVGDIHDVEVVIPLLTSDAARVDAHASVRLTTGTGASGVADTIIGTVQRVEPAAYTKVSALGLDEQRVNVIASVPAVRWRVGDHYRVQAQVTLWQTPRAVRVPTSALVREQSAWSVYVVLDGRARQRPVVIGARNAEAAEVVRGLHTGDQVVLYPGDAVRDGVRVRVSLQDATR